MTEKVDILQKEIEILIRKNNTLKDEIDLLQQQAERLKGQADIYKEFIANNDDCKHQWVHVNDDAEWSFYGCRKCGKVKRQLVVR